MGGLYGIADAGISDITNNLQDVMARAKTGIANRQSGVELTDTNKDRIADVFQSQRNSEIDHIKAKMQDEGNGPDTNPLYEKFSEYIADKRGLKDNTFTVKDTDSYASTNMGKVLWPFSSQRGIPSTMIRTLDYALFGFIAKDPSIPQNVPRKY